ncbi:HPr-rel-A system PqqD family peptide chaperone [Blastomonas sp. AAP53]|uniref:HPr-rel-A system PqqD family peptide chaperone n=1 Tax=Blastomonas sp. AAP53 TaxID=1248760 RepID=UPI00030CFA80|nr:HPr-rel-A system PqqD family peptide chaperone [Blastomonas sp. AAP53]
MPSAYAALPASALKRVTLGGLEAIYHLPSGITHLLAEPVPDLLDTLAAQAPGRYLTAGEVLGLIRERFDVAGDDPTEQPQNVLAERLAELAALGLVAVMHHA